MVVRWDRIIDEFEVPSKTDNIKDLYERMMNTLKKLGERGGSVEVVPIIKK